MISGSGIAPLVNGIWGSEFIENSLPPGFLTQKELSLDPNGEISQIGMMIGNTTKTCALFEINKGTNKNPSIDVNSDIKPADRRVPFQNMIYISDGPIDVPVFRWSRKTAARPMPFTALERWMSSNRIIAFFRSIASTHTDRRGTSPTAIPQCG